MTFRTALEQTCCECGKPTDHRNLICDECEPLYAPEPTEGKSDDQT